MSFLEEHGIGTGGTGLKRTFKTSVQLNEPAKHLNDLWIKTNENVTEVIFSHLGEEPARKEGTVWVSLYNVDMKLPSKKVLKLFTNKTEVNFSYSKEIVTHPPEVKLLLFKNKIMEIYGQFGSVRIFKNGKWNWLQASFWNGIMWVDCPTSEFYLYYASWGGKHLAKLGPDGREIWRVGNITSDFNKIAIDENRNIYATRLTYFVTKISPDGVANTDFYNTGNSDISVNLVSADKKGFVYVVQRGSRDSSDTIRKLDLTGKKVWDANLYGRGATNRLDVDKDGNIFIETMVGDNSTAILSKHTADGKEIWRIDKIKYSVLDVNGNAYMLGGYANGLYTNIIKVDKDGKEVWKKTVKAYDLSMGQDGLLYYNTENYYLVKMSPDGNEVARFRFKNAELPQMIAVDIAGYIYGAFGTNNLKTMKKISPLGEEVWSLVMQNSFNDIQLDDFIR